MSNDSLQNILPYLPVNLGEKTVLSFVIQDEEENKVFHDRQVAKLEVFDLSSYSSTNLTELNLGDKKFDLVYINSAVLAHFSQESDLNALFEKALLHLNHSGYLLIRDACYLQSRNPITYIDLVESRVIEAENSSKWGYNLVFVKSNDFKKCLVSILFQKTQLENFHGFKTLRDFMDHKQYSRNGVLTYEKIFGDGFVSTGGLNTTEKFLEDYIRPLEGQRLLDVGCGIGGGDFYISEKYGVDVFGIDLSSNMISIAWERSSQHPNAQAHFEIGDITKQRFPDESFDIIYSRDTILHIPNKEALFAQFHKWLKPGGKVFITDYCAGPKSGWSAEFANYVAQRGYDLREVTQYGQIFTDLGFKQVKAEDVTSLFVSSLEAELAKMQQIKDSFVSEFSEKDFNYLVEGWKAKLVRCANNEQKWGLFYCEK